MKSKALETRTSTIEVQGAPITIFTQKEQDFISLTDMVRNFEDGSVLIEKWLRNKNTIEFIGIWEQLHNPGFNSPEFGGIRNEAGFNRFSLSVRKWIQKTSAIGIVARTGRYGGTFAHKDIAFEFGSWLSPEFKLYLIVEFQRLKEEENRALSLEWSFQRTLSKVNYRIHTDAVKEKLIPQRLTRAQVNAVYATEADILNVALFGVTAREWRDNNTGKSGNIRDHATLEQLVVLSNLESINAVFIHQGLPSSVRLTQLNETAINQMRSLTTNNTAAARLASPVVKIGKSGKGIAS